MYLISRTWNYFNSAAKIDRKRHLYNCDYNSKVSCSTVKVRICRIFTIRHNRQVYDIDLLIDFRFIVKNKYDYEIAFETTIVWTYFTFFIEKNTFNNFIL